MNIMKNQFPGEDFIANIKERETIEFLYTSLIIWAVSSLIQYWCFYSKVSDKDNPINLYIHEVL